MKSPCVNCCTLKSFSTRQFSAGVFVASTTYSSYRPQYRPPSVAQASFRRFHRFVRWRSRARWPAAPWRSASRRAWRRRGRHRNHRQGLAARADARRRGLAPRQFRAGAALDPQGNGAPVHWSNPRTGSKGSFVQAGKPYPSDAVSVAPSRPIWRSRPAITRWAARPASTNPAIGP